MTDLVERLKQTWNSARNLPKEVKEEIPGLAVLTVGGSTLTGTGIYRYVSSAKDTDEMVGLVLAATGMACFYGASHAYRYCRDTMRSYRQH